MAAASESEGEGAAPQVASHTLGSSPCPAHTGSKGGHPNCSGRPRPHPVSFLI